MKESAKDRNKKVHVLLENLIKDAKRGGPTRYPSPFTQEEVETLMTSHIWGHREILLTILLVRMLDPKYRASKDFYECSPRAVYEGPIRALLRKNNIPHKKSPALNVAKNVEKIDETWAYGKRGGEMARVTVKIVKKIESVSAATLAEFARAYVRRFLAEAVRVAKIKTKVKKVEDPVFLARLCLDMIENVPDGGTTPQIIVGLLLENSDMARAGAVKVIGHLDSVSTTNTTSKKPGDAMEEFSDGSVRIYEVTVKAFSSDRMIESYEAVKAWDAAGKVSEVSVICRKKDVLSGAEKNALAVAPIVLGTASHQGITYYFIEIFSWIQEKLVSMQASGRATFYATLAAHVNEPGTSEKVKKYFAGWHSSRPL